LEKSLLEAAWEVLSCTGLAGFTMEAVATKAGTSRPVLYRRWSSVHELAMDAIQHRAAENPVAIPDTGNLRDDLVQFLDQVCKQREEILVLFSMGTAQGIGEGNWTLGEFFERLASGRNRIREILDRAILRGEIDGSRLTPRITSLPFLLVRYEVITTLKPVLRATLEEIIDDIFLPLVHSASRSGQTKP
jgi:AcrR family transcriptional regulator